MSKEWKTKINDIMTTFRSKVPLEYIELTFEIQSKPKCDCGGNKCRLPCLDWCSTIKENTIDKSR